MAAWRMGFGESLAVHRNGGVPLFLPLPGSRCIWNATTEVFSSWGLGNYLPKGKLCHLPVPWVSGNHRWSASVLDKQGAGLRVRGKGSFPLLPLFYASGLALSVQNFWYSRENPYETLLTALRPHSSANPEASPDPSQRSPAQLQQDQVLNHLLVSFQILSRMYSFWGVNRQVSIQVTVHLAWLLQCFGDWFPTSVSLTRL